MATQRAGYTRLGQADAGGAQGWAQSNDRRFETPESIRNKIPFKSILLALGLLAAGIGMITLGSMMVHGHFGGNEKGSGSGFICLGILVFLPGWYESRIAYYTWRGVRGYSYNQIPDY
mmetsp:Transcript_19976/g.63573  ORF Transcript_19976/g.63573 Transcript_19976/m.63573 type:complete len:118 (-) Transcript_19976:1407-1760(-)